MATKKIENSEDIMSLFNASMGESIKEPYPVKHWFDVGNLAINYIASKHLRAGIPSGRIICFDGLSGTGKSLFCCSILKDPTVDLGIIIETEGGGVSRELLEYVGVDIRKVNILKASTFECYRTNKKNQAVETVAEKDMPAKLETDQYVYTEGVTYLVKKIVDTVTYNPKLRDKNIVVILDSIANLQSVRELGGTADMGKKAQELARFFRTFDNTLERTGISFIFTNKLYTNFGDEYHPWVASGGVNTLYNPSLTIRLAETAANDDMSDAELKKNKEGKTGALGTDFKTLNASVIKSRFGTENKRVQFVFEANAGLAKYSGLFKLLKDYGLIIQSGAYYSCPTLWETKFYKKDFIPKFIENENENIDKLQAALDAWEENQRQEKLGKLGADVDTIIDNENADAEVDESAVDVNDMISALEA